MAGNNTCVCADGYWKDTEGRCQECHSSCLTCLGGDKSSDCTACDTAVKTAVNNAQTGP
jgi:hypothetical protein